MRKFALILSVSIMIISFVSSQPPVNIWYLKAGATGDGTSIDNPIGSTRELEDVTLAKDIIFVLPGDGPVEGGLALKDGQALIGLSTTGPKPVITNTDSAKNEGCGIVLSNDNRIWNVRIENTIASGILGTNVSGVLIDQVEVLGANLSGAYTKVGIKVLGLLPQGGIVFIASGSGGSGVNRVIQSEVSDARGFGIVTFAFSGAKSHLSISSSQVEGGSPVSRFDWGITAIAEGPSSEINLGITDTNVSGRLTQGGRNVVVLANSEGRAKARIEGSHLGEVGQDGVLAVASRIPAQVDLEIRDCLIEKAGWTNIEGTILNLPPSDPLRAHEARVSVEVVGSTLRDAGGENGFQGEKPENITMASSAFAQQRDPNSKAPFPPGNYQLTVRNSRLEGDGGYDIVIGNPGDRFELPPEQSNFEVQLRGNTISEIGDAEFLISAPKATIDARQNCWSNSEGLLENRILLKKTAKISQLDASDPLPCEEFVSN